MATSLIIWGEQDNIFPLTNAKRIVNGLPQAGGSDDLAYLGFRAAGPSVEKWVGEPSLCDGQGTLYHLHSSWAEAIFCGKCGR
ncbi:MAG TPA: hypothetical protein VGX03_08160, partial [Candidatus Binatia bacterium]|nr:hypothetical protein [Candidatus Binatia bacterium]